MRWPPLILAATAGLVAPLAIAPTTFDQRAALTLLLVAAAGLASRARPWPRPRGRLAILLPLLCATLLAATAPAALASEHRARAAIESRAGARLMALDQP